MSAIRRLVTHPAGRAAELCIASRLTAKVASLVVNHVCKIRKRGSNGARTSRLYLSESTPRALDLSAVNYQSS